MLLVAFFVTALLLFASDSLAFKESGGAESVRQSSETAKKAEELLQNTLLQFSTNDLETTRLRLQEVMSLLAQIGKPEKTAQVALQIADRYRQIRRYDDALYFYRQALDVKSLAGSLRLDALNAVALLYAQLYRDDLALPYYTDALKQAHAINDLSAQVLALTRLAELYHQKGDKDQSMTFIKKAQKLNEQRNAGADPALIYLLGQIRQEEGLVENAKIAFEEALAIYRKQGNAAGQAKILCSLSTISLRFSQNQEALEQATQAAELADKHYKQMVSAEDKASARELQWRSLVSRARAERAVGQTDKASKSYEFGIAQFEGVWWGRYVATEAGALASREEVQAAYRELVDVFMEQGRVEDAYTYVEQAKARALLSLTKGQRVAPQSDSSKQSAILREQPQLIARKRNELLSSDLSPEQRAQLQKDISDAERKLKEEQLRIDMIRSREGFVWANRLPAEKLKKQMARDQAGLVEFFLDEKSSYVWFFARGDVFVETLPPRKEIEKAVRSYLGTLAATPKHLRIEKDITRLRDQAKALFSNLFGSLSSHIEPGQRLIVVPDGLLYYLPFETLIHNERYLIEDHEISYSPSASMLGLLQNSGKQS